MKFGNGKTSISKPLYEMPFERSNCGVGVLVNLKGEKTHQLIQDGFTLLENLDHRGARGAEEKTGDGAGILLQKPHEFFQSEVDGLGDFDSYGVGMVFLPRDPHLNSEIRLLIEDCIRDENLRLISWREVPTDNADLGKSALDTEPHVVQFFVEPKEDLSPGELDSRLYVLRRVIENAAVERKPRSSEHFYICSLDRRKIVYKGLLTVSQLSQYYPELSDEKMKSKLVLVHSRFSTNTLGSWKLAHPYRAILHNGEINTVRGNINWMRAREHALSNPTFGDDIEKIKPITTDKQSDTAVLDNVLELLVESGRSLPHALRLLVPEAWSKDPLMDESRKAWYDYHSTMMEPWDGPALVAFTDGNLVGSILDRNGLRPARYYITTDDQFIMASEAGVLDTPPEKIAETGRLKPGQMLLVDPDKGGIIPDEEVFANLTDDKYIQWLNENRVKLHNLMEESEVPTPEFDFNRLTEYQRVFGYTEEDLHRFIIPMAQDGKDPVGAMGNDTPLSVLSNRNKTIFSYFKQLFAQVSNPPIDYIRENLVTSIESHIGKKGNLLDESPDHCRQLHLNSPILTDKALDTIRNMNTNGIKSHTIDCSYPNGMTLGEGIRHIREEAVQAIRDGYEILILSDKQINKDRIPVPSLLLIGGIHHYLIRKSLRSEVGLVLETGDPTDVHHFCTLIGYGADAINPYLAYASIRQIIHDETFDMTGELALNQYRKAVEDGIQKVMSKMGISTLESYKGAQIFEIVGINNYVVDEYFEGTVSRIEGMGFKEIERDIQERHDMAYHSRMAGSTDLDQEGEYYWRRDGEYHQWNPMTLGRLQHSARSNNYNVYKQFAREINEQENQLQTLRGMLRFDPDKMQSIPLEEVEPVESIFPRFFSSSMSFGSLSKEVHETLAIAMNRIGGRAGSGEGGEEVERFDTERECRIKQVASGRFGVTIDYLQHGTDIEIKMAQGSKPGEGGQLPGRKVNEVIARVRYTTPGVGLISPPPHHDIYSIEDLAQLIHDLKCANPDANIHVKLVAGAGVGTIAAGVAKAKADAILISGQSGGTGASAKTSIKSAGVPWELGLSEAHQMLMSTNLRSRVRLRVDGGLKTGRDIAIAAMLGAEEYGFGTASLVVTGCVMLRKCHTNTCSVGVATQNPELRKRFPGKPEHVINYMTFMAQEVREILASLGLRTMDELIGRSDMLMQRETDHPRARKLDLSPVMNQPESTDTPRKVREQEHHLERQLDNEFFEQVQPAIEHGEPVTIESRITNRHRTVGSMLSSRIAKKYGLDGLPDDTISIRLTGSAGQSFGAFLSHGVTMHLEGDANDYVGKGLSGGKLVVSTSPNVPYRGYKNIIIGNVALYGAIRGEAYFNGTAGERFGVRNSGVKAVVEGVGDHACEYMTGGVVVILSDTGRNFGAGMSGGEAFVLDESGVFDKKLNTEMVHTTPVTEERDITLLRRMIENHLIYTNSLRAKEILDDWDNFLGKFIKVIPDAYEAVVRDELRKGNDIRVTPPPLPQASRMTKRDVSDDQFEEMKLADEVVE
ncbi:MAG: glutamate synthase large subunit [Candidatus Marinimicrobia bacterium]|nr:glutamate synthase large subunit [Candidatus Neomarinimicrobiota bacterium]MCF7828497.1 glutamate synthase large subunit [Candidatus Neomarinimicrobiota bacterium]MCF7881987.1 glutamate synthase large subunit [Candidatus Neomarinimicrobiota bacterium]